MDYLSACLSCRLYFLTLFAMGNTFVLPSSAIFAQANEPVDAVRDANAAPKSFKLRMQVQANPGGVSEFSLVYQKPNKWRSVTRVAGGAGRFLEICDGRTAWSYQAGSDEYLKVDVAKLVQHRGEATAYRFLRERALESPGILSPFYANNEHWRQELASDAALKQLRSETINGVATIGFELPVNRQGTKFRMWFGKDDGLLRRQVLYRPNGDVWISWNSREVQLNAEVSDALFKFQFPDKSKIIDNTANVLQELTDLKKRDSVNRNSVLTTPPIRKK